MRNLFCFKSYILWKYCKTLTSFLTKIEISLCCVVKGKTGLKTESAGLWWFWRLRFKGMGASMITNCKSRKLAWDIYLLTYLLTPRCRVLLEKLTGLQLVKKFPVFHGTRRFITALTSVRHLSLSWASPIQSTCSHPTSWRSILILSTHLRLGLPSGLFPSGFPTKTLYTPLSSPIRATCPAHLIHLIAWNITVVNAPILFQ